MVNDFSAIDTLPPQEMFLKTIKLFPDHGASAAITLHEKFPRGQISPHSPPLEGVYALNRILSSVTMISKRYTGVNGPGILLTNIR
jgi:hypothetical protein